MGESIVPSEDQHLTTGWEADAPAGDTLVRKAVPAQSSWPIEVASALGRPSRKTPTLLRGRTVDRVAAPGE